MNRIPIRLPTTAAGRAALKFAISLDRRAPGQCPLGIDWDKAAEDFDKAFTTKGRRNG